MVSKSQKVLKNARAIAPLTEARQSMNVKNLVIAKKPKKLTYR